jgi:hypothetical protein
MGHRSGSKSSQCVPAKRREGKALTLLLLFAATLTLVFIRETPRAHADPLSPLQERLLYEGTVTDSDFFFLALFFGLSPGQQASYQATNSPTQSSGTLSGAPSGTNLNVTYSAAFGSATPGPTATWTGNGVFGQNSWNGSRGSYIY